MQSDKPLIVVGNGDVNEAILRKMAERYDVVALDGAYDYLVEMGYDVAGVIGDFDSLSDPEQISAKDILATKIAEQDSNDFEKALYSYNAPVFIGFGLFGGRFDHSIANLHIMAKYRQTKDIIAFTNDEIITIHQGTCQLITQSEGLLACLPLRPINFASSQGLLYPLDGLHLGIGDMVSSSNCATSDKVVITPQTKDADVPYAICRPLSLVDIDGFALSRGVLA